MVMSSAMGDVLRDRLPALWRRIEDAHYSYLETDDSPDKLQQKKKLQDYILEYLSLVPHECKFGLTETGKVFQKTINELPEFSAYRAGLGWAALERYAANLLAQPWRKEYRVIRLYCGYFKHEVEANLVGAEELLRAMGYCAAGAGRLQLRAPVCPDLAAAVSRDAIIAQCECQIMCHMWEAAWNSGSRTSWRAVARQRAERAGPATRDYDSSEIYSNIPTTITDSYQTRVPDPRYPTHCGHMCEDVTEENITPLIHPYMVPPVVPPMVYPLPPHMSDIPVTLPQCSSVPLMTAYGVPFYYPVQTPYMIPTPVYAPIKQAATVPVNGGYSLSQYRYPLPAVPTAQLIELDTPYENGKFERQDEERTHKRRQLDSKRHSTSKSNLISSSDVSLPSLPRSDTQPVLSKAKEDGMGTYESWDYVFRNLSSKDQDRESRSRFSPSLDRDSRTLDRLDREERRAKYQPTTLDLEDGLQALNLDRTYDDDVYRTAKVNENLMRLKQERDLKAKHLTKKHSDERRKKEPVGNPTSDALISAKIAQDKVKLLSKKDIKDRKEVIKQQSVNGSVSQVKVKKPAKLVPVEVEKRSKENGVHAHGSKTASISSSGTSAHHSKHDLKAQLVVSLDEPDTVRSSPKPTQNGDRPTSRTSVRDKWECATCTYLNKSTAQACEMCGKSKRGPEIQPLRSGGRECPACTLVNERMANVCDACGTSLQHCPTYI